MEDQVLFFGTRDVKTTAQRLLDLAAEREMMSTANAEFVAATHVMVQLGITCARHIVGKDPFSRSD